MLDVDNMLEPLVAAQRVTTKLLEDAFEVINKANGFVIPVKLQKQRFAARWALKAEKGGKFHASQLEEDPDKFTDEKEALRIESQKPKLIESNKLGGQSIIDGQAKRFDKAVRYMCTVNTQAETEDTTKKYMPELMKLAKAVVGNMMVTHMNVCTECIQPEFHTLRRVSSGGKYGVSSIIASCTGCIGNNDSFRIAAEGFADAHHLSDVTLTQTTSFHWTIERFMERVKSRNRNYETTSAAANNALSRTNAAMAATITTFCSGKPSGNASAALEACYTVWIYQVNDISYNFIRELKAVSKNVCFAGN